MAKHLLNGSHAKNIATRWRLEARLEALEQELSNNKVIAFNHRRREGNKVADLLANIGVESELTLQAGTLDILKNHAQAQECNHLVQNDANPSDVGAS